MKSTLSTTNYRKQVKLTCSMMDSGLGSISSEVLTPNCAKNDWMAGRTGFRTFSWTLIHGSEKSRFKTHILEHSDAERILIKKNTTKRSDSRLLFWPSFIQSYTTFLLYPTKGHWTLCFYISDSIFYFPKGLVWGSGLGVDRKEVVGSLNSSL